MSVSESYFRECYICLESETAEVAETQDSQWVSPCRCAGTVKWVHQSCIVRWVRDQKHRGVVPSCGQCRTRLRVVTVVLPKKGWFHNAVDFLYHRANFVSQLLIGNTLVAINWSMASATLGAFALTQVYGVTEVLKSITAIETLFSVETLKGFICLQFTACSLVFVNYVPWEDCMLRVMRRCSKIPILGELLPKDAPIQFHEVHRRKSPRQVIGRAVLTPVIARIVGNVFFTSVEAPLRRVVLGGAAFLAVKGAVYMYVTQKLLRRRQQVDILPVEEAR